MAIEKLCTDLHDLWTTSVTGPDNAVADRHSLRQTLGKLCFMYKENGVMTMPVHMMVPIHCLILPHAMQNIDTP